jgi:dTDP-4-dehydrorhamnose reductase
MNRTIEQSRIAVIGNGQLALAMLDTLRAAGANHVTHLHRPHFDLTESATFPRLSPHTDMIINCAAYNAVDAAEGDKQGAWAVNYRGVSSLASFCDLNRCLLVHVSTDYVFPGTAITPYFETDPPDPINIYGQSKLKGEQVIQDKLHDGRYLIVRTAGVWTDHPARRSNFPYKILARAQKGDVSNILRQRKMRPTYAPHLSDAMLALIDWYWFVNGTRRNDGIFHITNSGPEVSWFRFALEFCKAHGVANADDLVKGTFAYPERALRPAFSVLDLEKFTDQVSHPLPTWQESIEEVAKA